MRQSWTLAAAAAASLLALGACAPEAPAPASAAAPPAASATDVVARGKYLANIMDCAGCHRPGALTGQARPDTPLSGSQEGFEIPGFGVVYPPNLTPHETGLGAWTEEQIITAVTKGERPDGRILAPIMPSHAYANLTPDDARALAAYLKSLPPVEHKVPGPTTPEQAKTPYLTMKVPAA
ncbi:c-type cytochrome [Phenylobacterium terrae]|uniref:C-type cytochrome n=1 Tax=Phenylobacterium terrae TaxID=2665495 RepID=A0ABW4N516_9CAUL